MKVRELCKHIRQSAAMLLIAAMITLGLESPAYAARLPGEPAAEDISAGAGIPAAEEILQGGESSMEEIAPGDKVSPYSGEEPEALAGADAAVSYDGMSEEEKFNSYSYIPEGNLNYIKAVMDNRGRVKVTWKKFSGSKYYRLYRYVSDYNGMGVDGFREITPNLTTNKSYQFGAYDHSASYIFKVVGYDKYRTVCGAYTAVCVPYALAVESSSTEIDSSGMDKGDTTLTFAFAHSKCDKIKYRIERASAEEKKSKSWNYLSELGGADAAVSPYNGEKIKIPSIDAVFYRDDTFYPWLGDTYYYRVSAYILSSEGTEVPSGLSKTVSTKVSIPAPYMCEAYTDASHLKDGDPGVGGNTAYIAFNRIQGAESYEIYSSTKPKTGYKKSATVTRQAADSEDNRYYRDDGTPVEGWCVVRVKANVKPETQMYYRVRAVARNSKNKKIYGAFSTYDSATTHMKQIVDLTAEAAGEENYIEVTFSSVTGANRYYLDRRVYRETGNPSQWANVAYEAGTAREGGYRSIVDKKDLRTNQVYEYRIRPAYGKKTCVHVSGDDLMRVHVTCIDAAAKFTVSAASLTTVRVAWGQNKSVNTTAYKLEWGERLTEKGEIYQPHTVTMSRSENASYFRGRYYLIQKLLPFQNIYVRYCPVVDGVEQKWSEIRSAMPVPRKITGVRAAYYQAGKGAKLTWDKSRDEEVARYVVERSTRRNFDRQYTEVLTGAEGTAARNFTDNLDMPSGKIYYYRVAGIWYDSETKSYREGVWSDVIFSKPREIEVIDRNGDVRLENGVTREKPRGFSGTFTVQYLDSVGEKFSPSVSKLTWGTNSGWASIQKKDGKGGEATIKIDSAAPSGTVIEFWVQAENRPESNGLYKYFYIKIK